jgi:hypothetical protein
MAYIWEDGSVTGSIHWDELRGKVKNRDQDGVTDEGWARLEQLVADHDAEVGRVESDAEDRARAAAKANAEAGAFDPANPFSDDASSEVDDADGEDDEEEPGLTKAELQEELRARGLPTSGNKAELQQRLDEADEEA